LTYASEKYEFVTWDDEIPDIWKSKKMFQTTNQISTVGFGNTSRIFSSCLDKCHVKKHRGENFQVANQHLEFPQFILHLCCPVKVT